MESIMEVIRIVLPLIIVGGIALFVVTRLKNKSKQGTLGKKKTKNAQILLDSLIPLGLLAGCLIGLVFNLFFPFQLSFILTFGAAFGLLAGYFAYEYYSDKE
ncbi:hypothetical protein [Carnobacterium sp.]|uniref:hypothetical protein n=1 Tax=Carnobacterium sp. TaxID=48221 RepID=UPI003C7685C3